MSYQSYQCVRHGVTEISEVSGTGIDVAPILVPTPVQTFIPVPPDVVPDVPKCPIPVLMSYRTYRRVRHR